MQRTGLTISNTHHVQLELIGGQRMTRTRRKYMYTILQTLIIWNGFVFTKHDTQYQHGCIAQGDRHVKYSISTI